MEANRFRFRAWHKEDKKMGKVACVHTGERPGFIRATVIFKRSERSTEYRDIMFENCVLMQSTGLVDSKGTEIFESDILKLDEDIWPDIPEHFVVTYNPDKSALGVVQGTDTIIQDITNPSCPANNWLVVGNVHENPELKEGT